MSVKEGWGSRLSTAVPTDPEPKRWWRLKAFKKSNAVAVSPLSGPGAPGRIAPFAGAAIIALGLVLLPPTSPDPSLVAAAAVLMAVVISAGLLLPWKRLPLWCQASVPLSFFAVIVLLRQAGAGESSGYSPLVMLPILWLALYGSHLQFRLAIVATALTLLGPLILVGPPHYPAAGWRQGVIWVVIGLFGGSAAQSLVDQSRHRSADVAALGAITRTLTAGSDPRPELCSAAQLVTGAAFAILYEPHIDGDLVATASSDEIVLGPLRIDPRVEASRTGEAWRTGARTYIADIAADPRALTRLADGAEVGAMLFQPITRDGRRMGVLTIGFREARSSVPERAIFLIELLAAEIGAAIDRAELVARLATQSRSDPLTGAANRRSWDEELDRELARARRGAIPLTVALMDMDHFKDYNDAHGHVAGDVLLKDLVTAIRTELRAGNIIARWGGDEFALALTDCDLQQAQAISARLLRVVPSGQTASIGLSEAKPQDTPQALIERADQALYTAKNGGRNQVSVFQVGPPLGLVQGHGG